MRNKIIALLVVVFTFGTIIGIPIYMHAFNSTKASDAVLLGLMIIVGWLFVLLGYQIYNLILSYLEED